MILICIFLMTGILNFFVMYLLALSMFSFEKWVLKHFIYIYIYDVQRDNDSMLAKREMMIRRVKEELL